MSLSSSTQKMLYRGVIPFAVLLPIAIIYTAYLGFTTNYTAHVFGVNSFTRQYQHGIFRYRVLGRAIQLVIYECLKTLPLPNLVRRGIELDPAFSPAFYYSYMVNNGVFLIGFSVTFWRFLHSRLAQAQAFSLYLLVLFYVTLSLSVVTPYDQLAYFLVVLAAAVFHDPRPLARLAVIIVIALGTLNRETPALDLAYFFTVLALPEAPQLRRERILRLALALFTYLTVYISLRLYYGFSHAIIQGYMFAEEDLKDYGGLILITILYSIFIMALPAMTGDRIKLLRQRTILFYLACMPYLVTVFVGGLWFEIRLWIPVIILHAVLVAATARPAAVSTPAQAGSWQS